jgi:SAM-dependent methyltransferase
MSRPEYDAFTGFEQSRGEKAEMFARQVLATTASWSSKPVSELEVLDVGSGYGHTARELAKSCRTVVGLEPMGDLHHVAQRLAENVPPLSFRHGGVEDLSDVEAFDLIVLDNVYEHLPDHELALERITTALRPGGVLYLLVPNRLWPLEAHYRLPFLSWLPLPLANRYLQLSGRGADYADASHAPTYWSLRRELGRQPDLDWTFTLPGDPTATQAGTPLHYRLGMAALAKLPALWAISKALLVVATKYPRPPI